jgi:hypothetical protein
VTQPRRDGRHAKLTDGADRALRRQANTVTFEDCLENYITAHRSEWRRLSEKQRRQSLVDYAFPVFGKNPASAIDTPMALRVVQPIWTIKHRTAARTRSAGYRDKGSENPASWDVLKDLLAKPSKIAKTRHHPAFSATLANTGPAHQIAPVRASACQCAFLGEGRIAAAPSVV